MTLGMFEKEEKAVALLTELLALECNCKSRDAKMIGRAALLHDIGKRQIPRHILNKPGALSIAEFEIMKEHTVLGRNALKHIQGEFGEMSRYIALFHHEWYNGEGNYGIPAHILPNYVQKVAVCDVFVALLYSRPYKPAWACEEALEYILAKSSTQFAPWVVKVFSSFVKRNKQDLLIFSQAKSEGRKRAVRVYIHEETKRNTGFAKLKFIEQGGKIR